MCILAGKYKLDRWLPILSFDLTMYFSHEDQLAIWIHSIFVFVPFYQKYVLLPDLEIEACIVNYLKQEDSRFAADNFSHHLKHASVSEYNKQKNGTHLKAGPGKCFFQWPSC